MLLTIFLRVNPAEGAIITPFLRSTPRGLGLLIVLWGNLDVGLEFSRND